MEEKEEEEKNVKYTYFVVKKANLGEGIFFARVLLTVHLKRWSVLLYAELCLLFKNIAILFKSHTNMYG